MREQLLERMKHTADSYTQQLGQLAKHVDKMQDYNTAVIAEAVTTSGCGIVDALNNLSLILLELLPEEAQP